MVPGARARRCAGQPPRRWDAALPLLTSALAAQPDDPRPAGAAGPHAARAGPHRRRPIAGCPPAAHRDARTTPTRCGWRRWSCSMSAGWTRPIGLAARAVAREPNVAANHLALSRAWAQSSRAGSRRPPARRRPGRRSCWTRPARTPTSRSAPRWPRTPSRPQPGRPTTRRLRLDPGNSAALNNLAVLDLQAGCTRTRPLGTWPPRWPLDPHGTVPRRNLDAVAIRVVRRVGWWMLLAPVPALIAAALDAPRGDVDAGRGGRARAAVGVRALVASPDAGAAPAPAGPPRTRALDDLGVAGRGGLPGQPRPADRGDLGVDGHRGGGHRVLDRRVLRGAAARGHRRCCAPAGVRSWRARWERLRSR